MRLGQIIAIACGAALLAAGETVAGDEAAALKTIDSEPIKCWWKSDKTAVQVAERFVVTLTCGVIETRRVTVVPNLDQLDAGALQLAPFEALSGVRHEDITAGLWRYVQYDYTMRFVEDNFFRADAEIPALPINYTIQTVAGAAAQQGRELTYLLPPLSMRINSLVPKGAEDIRDAPRTSFADIDARAFRALWERALAVILFCFAAVLLGAGLARAMGRRRERTPSAERVLSNFAVLHASLLELQRLSAAHGTPPLQLTQALAALRVAGAVALSKPVTRGAVNAAPHGGQLSVRGGWLRRESTPVSAATTARTLARALERSTLPPARRQVIKELQEALTLLTAMSYGREATYDPALLRRMLQRAAEAVRRLRNLTFWPNVSRGRDARRSTARRDVVWSS